MNFNFGETQEYSLNSSLIEEVISMYGVRIKLILQERVTNDQVVFGDFSHLFSDGEHSFEMFALPENPEELDNQEIQYSNFGLQDLNSLRLFIHRESLMDLPGVEPLNQNSREYQHKMKPNVQDLDYHLIGHLIVLPNGKIFEITDQKYSVPGINNLYTSKNDKSVYKITCVPWMPKLENELDSMDISTLGSQEEQVNSLIPNMSLEDYFSELKESKEDQDFESEINDLQNKLIGDTCKVSIPTSTVDKTEKQAWE